MLSMRDELDFSEATVEVIVAAAKFGAFFGTFLGGGLMLYYGRRTTIALDSVFFMLGPIIMASASGVVYALQNHHHRHFAFNMQPDTPADALQMIH